MSFVNYGHSIWTPSVSEGTMKALLEGINLLRVGFEKNITSNMIKWTCTFLEFYDNSVTHFSLWLRQTCWELGFVLASSTYTCFLHLLFLFSCWYKTLRNYLRLSCFFFGWRLVEIWTIPSFSSNFSILLCLSILFPLFLFPPLGGMWQEGAASFCPLNLSLLKKQPPLEERNLKIAVFFSLNFYGVKSEGLYVRKNMYKHSNFNTWLTNSVTSCIKRGHLRKGPFLPALPFALSPLACRAAMQSLCLGFQGLQSVWGRGHAGPVSRPV